VQPDIDTAAEKQPSSSSVVCGRDWPVEGCRLRRISRLIVESLRGDPPHGTFASIW
jgi:hypothetical protein